MKLFDLTSTAGQKIAIPVDKITGITESNNKDYGNTYVATGADTPDGGENGWYVQEKYIDVRMMLEEI